MAVDPVGELEVRAALEALGVPYEIVECDPPKFAACVVLATTKLDVNRAVRQRFGVKKASFASGEQTQEITGMMIGGVTPFALPPDMPIWVDSRVVKRERLLFGGGSRSCKVVGPPALLTSQPQVEVVEALAISPE